MTKGEIKPFGGDWSGKKLEALRAYLASYMQVMKKQPFQLAYIDAFAGAGLREVSNQTETWFDEMQADEEARDYRHGSPLIALSHDPAFDKYIFIEKDSASIDALKQQVRRMTKVPQERVSFRQGDANEQLQALTAKKWRSHRAVAFLDPFALEVNWETIETIGQTQAIDMWLLFPAMAVNRMLPKSGDIPEKWSERLDRLFGAHDWATEFYSNDQQSLFGDEVLTKTPRIFESLSNYVTKRLGTVFAGTHKSPLILHNRSGAPLFLLCFASGNPKGARIATGIAQHIIDKGNHG